MEKFHRTSVDRLFTFCNASSRATAGKLLENAALELTDLFESREHMAT